LADSAQEAQQLFHKYVQGHPEEIHSSFDDREIDVWAIKLLAQVRSISVAEFSQLLTSTFGGFRQSLVDPSWPDRMALEVPNLVNRFQSHGLIDHFDGDLIALSPLGTTCGRASFSISSALNLIEMVNQQPELFHDDETFVVSLLTLPEIDERFIPLTRGNNPESHLTGLFSNQLPSFPSHILHRRARDVAGVRRRCKKALVLIDWMNGEPINVIEERYSANLFSAVRRGDIVGLADTLRFHLSSAAEIVEIISPHENLGKVVEDALFRLEFGLPASAASLVAFPFRLERGEILRLLKFGLIDLFAASPEQVSEVFSQERQEEVTKVIESSQNKQA